MSDTIIVTKELAQAWRELAVDVKKNKKLNFEIFDSLFSQTYSLLSKKLAENSLDKSYVGLVAEAFLFANIKDEALDYMCLSAFVLTERMLTYCVFNGPSTHAETPTIYMVEARKEILLDFGDVGESISRLTKIFEDIYWKNVKK